MSETLIYASASISPQPSEQLRKLDPDTTVETGGKQSGSLLVSLQLI